MFIAADYQKFCAKLHLKEDILIATYVKKTLVFLNLRVDNCVNSFYNYNFYILRNMKRHKECKYYKYQ